MLASELMRESSKAIELAMSQDEETLYWWVTEWDRRAKAYSEGEDIIRFGMAHRAYQACVRAWEACTQESW